jgi:hypothetical protein
MINAISAAASADPSKPDPDVAHVPKDAYRAAKPSSVQPLWIGSDPRPSSASLPQAAPSRSGTAGTALWSRPGPSAPGRTAADSARPEGTGLWDSTLGALGSALGTIGSAVAGAASVLTRPIAGALAAQKLDERMLQSAIGARQEWENGVREDNPRTAKNRSERIDEYARNAGFNPKKGLGWCGFFVAFNYAQNGFKHSSSLASMPKARDFFLYRNYTKSTSNPANAKYDALRAEHEAAGSSRNYFMLEESPDLKRIRGNPKRYGHVDLEKSTFKYDTLPIQAGDTVLFNPKDGGNGHVGMVLSYDRATGLLITIEGNTDGEAAGGGRVNEGVARKVYDLKDPAVRKKFAGFGRPAAGDFD